MKDDQQLDSTLQSAGSRWRATRPTGPDLMTTLSRAVDEQPALVRSHRGVRRWVVPMTVAAVIVAGAATPLLIVHHHTRSTAAASGTTQLATCGTQPISDGPHAKTIKITLTAPKTVTAGSRIAARVSLAASAVGPVTLITSLPAQLVILQNGEIVGRYLGPRTGVGASVDLGQTAKTVNASLDTRGCGSETLFRQDQKYQAPFLPAGDYQLMAMLPDLPADASAESNKVLASPAVDFSISAS
jgi:hypothetical protein